MPRIPIVAVALLLLPNAMLAQSRPPEVRVSPKVGAFVPDKGVGSADGRSLELRPAAALGLDAELLWPGSWLGLRAGIERTVGAGLAYAVPVTGFDPAGRDRGRATHVYEHTGVGGALSAAAVDLTLRPKPATWAARPYLFAGLALKHYDWDQAQFSEAEWAALGDDVLGRAIHLGAGSELRVRRASVSIEAGSYSGRHPDAATLKHDLFVSFGVRLDPRPLLGR